MQLLFILFIFVIEPEKSISINIIDDDNIQVNHKVKYRQLKSKMGQKVAKIVDDEQFNNNNNNNSVDENIENSNHLSINTNNIGLIRTKLNHHDSALSNDSGCYSNTDSVDRYSSPSNSSVICLFDHQQSQMQQQTLVNKCTNTRIENQSSDEVEIINDKNHKNNNVKTFSSPFFKHKLFKTGENKQKQSSSLLTKTSTGNNNDLTRSVSSLDLFNNNKTNSSHSSTSNLKIKVDTLYKQINQILHFKSNLTNNEINNDEDKTGKESNSKNKKIKQVKTSNNQKNSTIMNKLASLRYPNKTYLSRSNTFNSSYVTQSVDDVHKNANNDENNKISNKFGKNLIKNGRKLLNWKKNSSQEEQQQKDDALMKICNNKINKKNLVLNNSSDNKNTEILNLLAAKLLSESIDLTKYPYTDDVSNHILIGLSSINYYLFI